MTTKKKTTTKRKSAAETRTVEFTPAQFLGAIVTLVCFGLVCFVLGIIVNRVDNARRDSQIAQTQQVQSGEGQQQSAPASVENPDRIEVAEREPAKTTKETYRTIPVPDGSGADRNAAVNDTTPEEEPAAEEPTPEEPVVVAEAEPESVPEPAELPSEEPTPAEAPAPTPAATGAKGNWTIQVAAYGVDNKARAETFINTIESDTGIRPKLVPSPDGKFLRVWIGEFDDKAAADAMKLELEGQPALKGCIVKQIG